MKEKKTKLLKFDMKFVEMAEKLKAAGFSNNDLAYVFGVYDHSRINNWMKKVPELEKAIESGRQMARKKLIAKGLKAAWGYDYEEFNEKWKPDKESGELILESRSVFKKHKPADSKLMCTFLAVLDPEFKKVFQKATDAVNKKIVVKIDGKVEASKIEQLADKLLAEDTQGVERKSIVSTIVGGDADE